MRYSELARPIVGDKMRGPHQGKELELMMQGMKPVAMPDVAHRESFERVYKNLGWSRREFYHGHGFKDVLFSLPGEEWRMQRIIDVYHNVLNGHLTRKDHITLGLLLGYDKEAIRFFINNPFKVII